jgi:hypothetical protein
VDPFYEDYLKERAFLEAEKRSICMDIIEVESLDEYFDLVLAQSTTDNYDDLSPEDFEQ